MDPFFTGLLQGGFARKREIEHENIQRADRESEMEQAVLLHLMTADDPRASGLAINALLAGPQKKASGLAGWIGKSMATPEYQELQRYLRTPQPTMVEEEKTTLPSRQFSGGAALGQTPQGMGEGSPTTPAPQPAITTPPSGAAPAGMAATSPVQPGGPPPTPVSVVNAPPTPYTISRMAMRTPQAFLPPVEKAKQNAVAKEVGDITGMRAGMKAAGLDDATIDSALRQHVAGKYGSALPFQHMAVEAPDGKGGYAQQMATYDRRSGQYLDDYQQPIYGARPLQRTGSAAFTNRDALVRAVFGNKYGQNVRAADLNQADMQQVLEVEQAQKNGLTTKDALGFANRFLPNATLDEQLALADTLKGATQPPAPGAAAGAGTSAAAPPPPTALGGMQALPPLGGSAAAPPTAPASSAAAPPKLSGLRGAITPTQGAQTKQTGVAPKPLPAATAGLLAKAKATNDLIDQAITALSPFKDDNSLATSIKMAEGYRHGEYSPVFSAVAAQTDLASIQQKSQTQLGNSRAARFIVEKGQHVPRLPSGRQAQAAHLFGPKWTERLSEWKGDEGGFDTPQLMYLKLQKAKENNVNFIRELEQSGAPPAPGSGANGPTGSAGAATPTSYQDAQGVWHIRQ